MNRGCGCRVLLSLNVFLIRFLEFTVNRKLKCIYLKTNISGFFQLCIKASNLSVLLFSPAAKSLNLLQLGLIRFFLCRILLSRPPPPPLEESRGCGCVTLGQFQLFTFFKMAANSHSGNVIFSLCALDMYNTTFPTKLNTRITFPALFFYSEA